MYNSIHIDEKWLYMTNAFQRYYLHPNKDEPFRSCKSNRFIGKVIFMATIARPRYGFNGEVLFDSKISIFPFVINEPAKRKSKNWAARVMEMKSMNSVTKEVIKECIIQQRKNCH